MSYDNWTINVFKWEGKYSNGPHYDVCNPLEGACKSFDTFQDALDEAVAQYLGQAEHAEYGLRIDPTCTNEVWEMRASSKTAGRLQQVLQA